MYGGFGLDENGEITEYNIWSNMDFLFHPIMTKRKLREAKAAEDIKRREEENRLRDAEYEKALKSLEELRKKYNIPQFASAGHASAVSIASDSSNEKPIKKKPVKQSQTNKSEKKQVAAKSITKSTTKKTPKGGKK